MWFAKAVYLFCKEIDGLSNEIKANHPHRQVYWKSRWVERGQLYKPFVGLDTYVLSECFQLSFRDPSSPGESDLFNAKTHCKGAGGAWPRRHVTIVEPTIYAGLWGWVDVWPLGLWRAALSPFFSFSQPRKVLRLISTLQGHREHVLTFISCVCLFACFYLTNERPWVKMQVILQ